MRTPLLPHRPRWIRQLGQSLASCSHVSPIDGQMHRQCVYVHMCGYVHMEGCVHTCMHVCVCAYVCVCVHHGVHVEARELPLGVSFLLSPQILGLNSGPKACFSLLSHITVPTFFFFTQNSNHFKIVFHSFNSNFVIYFYLISKSSFSWGTNLYKAT